MHLKTKPVKKILDEFYYIDLPKEFTRHPASRKDGTKFRKQFLEPFYQDKTDDSKIFVSLDEVDGYSTAFLKAAFVELAVKYGVDKVSRRLHFVTKEDPLLAEEVEHYVKEAVTI